uniref:hypothetical protein n=1 Tax=uncultured Deinococcus sp. TaxID=158789 RepID=UPI0025D7F4C0
LLLSRVSTRNRPNFGATPLYVLSAPYRFVGCGVTVNATSTQFAIKASSTRALLDVMGGQWSFPFYGVERRAGQLAYTNAARILIDLPDGLMNTAVKVSGYAVRPYLPRDAVMAVRADAGKLQPLLYDGRFRSVTVDSKVKTLEITVKSSRGVLWKRMRLDVVNSTITFIKESDFPVK